MRILLAVIVLVAACSGSTPGSPVTTDQLASACEPGFEESRDEARSAPVADADIRLTPGDDVAGSVALAGPGAVIVFDPGVYEGVSINPQPGQQFFGEFGAVLQGGGAPFAFRSVVDDGLVADVVIDGFEITGYSPEGFDGVIEGGVRWVVSNNHIHHNGEIGIHDLGQGHVIGNVLHHNGRYAISGGGFALIEDNLIACNANEFGLTGDSGATKFVFTTDLVIRNNEVRDNYSHGIWVDIDNVNALTENNLVVNNRGNGIFYEIGCDPGGVIRNNMVEQNGFPDRYPAWVGDTAGIVVSMTSGVEIYDNTLAGNTKGIGGIEWNHPDVGLVQRCEPHLQDLHVYDNLIEQSGGAAAGIDATRHRSRVWADWGNRFERNIYVLSDDAGFRWEGRWLSEEAWEGAGQS